jgi:hypothetical protein
MSMAAALAEGRENRMPTHDGITSSLLTSRLSLPGLDKTRTGLMTRAGTEIRINIWDEVPASLREDRQEKSHTLKLGRHLTEANKVRVLVALGNISRTLQLCLDEEGSITGKGGNGNARFSCNRTARIGTRHRLGPGALWR